MLSQQLSTFYIDPDPYQHQSRSKANTFASSSNNEILHTTSTYEANAVLLLVLVAAGTVFRNSSLCLTLVFWVIVPIALMPYWLSYWRVWDTFLWIKVFSLMPLVTVFVSCSRLGILDPQWIPWGSFFLLSLNITEAIAKDILSKHPVNAMSGFFLILAEIPTLNTIMLGERNVILWSLGKSWILAYTIWNWMLVYNNYPYAVGRHTAVLLAPIVLALVDGWEEWAEARSYTLAFYFALRNTFYKRLRSATDIDNDETMTNRTFQVLAFISVLCLLQRSILSEAR
jgi:hypothetical protein